MTSAIGLEPCLECNRLGLGTPSSDGEASATFETILEPLVAQSDTPSGEPPSDAEPVPADTVPMALGVLMSPFPAPDLSVPLPPTEGHHATERVEPATIAERSLPSTLYGLLESVHFDAQTAASSQPTLSETVAFQQATNFVLPTDGSEDIPLPEAMMTLGRSVEGFREVPQESATGVSESSMPASPARQEAPLTSLFFSEGEATDMTMLARGNASATAGLEFRGEEEPSDDAPTLPGGSNGVGHLLSHPFLPEAEELASTPGVVPQRYSDAVIEQVANHLERLIAQQERSRIQFRLDPPELGTVEIRIEVQGNSVQAWLMADQETTRHALNQHAQHLREQLAERGLNLTQFEVGYGSSQSYAEREAQTQSRYTPAIQPNLRPPTATESLQRVAYNPNGQWSVWA